MVVVGIRLHEVDQVETVYFVFASVLNPKVVPLRVSVCPVVILQEQVIFKVINFHCLAQICTFEATLEYQSLVAIWDVFELVVGLQVLVISVQSRTFFVTHAPLCFLTHWHLLGTVVLRLL